ncbi:ral guanine nucleotide dissociation stimulator-like isoform X1 [Elephas maximus indicus]|uniref:ral guanine nucleotide dissociation stimulator-like isoform X1 n=1 Tax=Elephas maximus indicus TaxID=99487 RepID=UPI0021165D34|nr:ral guanine nucleotide dissociation stimulator-like isoform X1 [Elephas maximus indicus]XP_049726771.1 ral guanine nucleotide dissociation stimulator-like isoform X1 [Elephas maximus indicus]XP_049726772.1 ral guanine nucleotide dissociation stimulator-like isoform X1 [Elephas maximus indicus]XP_049726773.1 ral guanine nucleotide dissociation stimulator-like isoform X1 [Elephas maximus indicus]
MDCEDVFEGCHTVYFRCVCGSDEDLDEAWVTKTFKAGSLEKLVENLVPAFLKGDFSYIEIFLGTYRTYATTQQVLDQLLQRYGCNHPSSAQDGEPQEQLKGAISFILDTWLKEYLEDFDEPPYFPCLKLVVEYVQVNMPGSHLERHAQLLLAQLDQMEVTEPQPEAPEPRPGPVVKVAQDPSLPQELAPAPCSGVYSAPVLAPELHSTPPIISPAPAPAPDREAAGGVDSQPGSPPELALGSLADVSPASDATAELHTTPAISSPAPALAPDGGPAGGSESYPGPPSELAPGPLATVNPAPAPIPELDVAQALLQLHHQHPMDNWMERWIPILGFFQNRNLDHQLMSILLLLQHRSSVEQQLFHDQLQLWQQRNSPMDVRILNLDHLESETLDNLVMEILVLNRHRSSIEHQQLQHCQEMESWIFTLGDFQNRIQDQFLRYILSLQQRWSRVQQQVLHHQVEQAESLLEDRILFLGQHHNGLLDHLVELIMLLD